MTGKLDASLVQMIDDDALAFRKTAGARRCLKDAFPLIGMCRAPSALAQRLPFPDDMVVRLHNIRGAVYDVDEILPPSGHCVERQK